MPSELHEKMVFLCKSRLTLVLDTKEQQLEAIKEHNRKQPIPDLVTFDKKLAVECCTLDKSAMERLLRYSKCFPNLILAFPFYGNISEIWMYNPLKDNLDTFVPK